MGEHTAREFYPYSCTGGYPTKTPLPVVCRTAMTIRIQRFTFTIVNIASSTLQIVIVRLRLMQISLVIYRYRIQSRESERKLEDFFFSTHFNQQKVDDFWTFRLNSWEKRKSGHGRKTGNLKSNQVW